LHDKSDGSVNTKEEPAFVSDLQSQTNAEDSGLEKALGKALKFTAVDLAANRNGALGRNQRLRLLVRGSLLLLFLVVLTLPTAFAYVTLRSFDATSTKLVLVIVLAELAIYFVVGSRGVKMLMDAFSSHTVRRTGKLIFGDTLQPACSANFIDDTYDPDLSNLRMFFEGLDAYLMDWTREPDDIGIRLPCEVVGPAPKDRRCLGYYSRWTHRLMAVELGPPPTIHQRDRKEKQSPTHKDWQTG
jgi:hypothetical protein